MKATPASKANHQHHQAGIALVVIAALFVAFSVIAAVLVERNTTTQLITRRDTTNEQLTRISNALIEYSIFNNNAGQPVYPCPAQPSLATTAANFGKSVEIANGYAQNCSNVAGDVAGSPVTTISGNLEVLGGAVGGDVIRGMVPIQDLSQYGLSVNDAFDSYNNRIMYVVNRQLTRAGSGSNTNNPTIADTITNQTLTSPGFILISHGRDGVGATRRESTTVSIACTNATTTARFENCDADTSFTVIPTNTAATATSTSYFDDILTFYR